MPVSEGEEVVSSRAGKLGDLGLKDSMRVRLDVLKHTSDRTDGRFGRISWSRYVREARSQLRCITVELARLERIGTPVSLSRCLRPCAGGQQPEVWRSTLLLTYIRKVGGTLWSPPAPPRQVGTLGTMYCFQARSAPEVHPPGCRRLLISYLLNLMSSVSCCTPPSSLFLSLPVLHIASS